MRLLQSSSLKFRLIDSSQFFVNRFAYSAVYLSDCFTAFSVVRFLPGMAKFLSSNSVVATARVFLVI